jgi:hypothetical protein
MRRFQFRLERVLCWHRSQLDQEEAKLRNLLAELASIQASIAELDSSQGPQRMIVHDPAATPGERVGLDHWLRWARLERDCRVSNAAACEGRIVAQRLDVVRARRKVELLEKLRTKGVDQWTVEMKKELEALADEAFAAKWERE